MAGILNLLAYRPPGPLPQASSGTALALLLALAGIALVVWWLQRHDRRF